MKPILKYPGGKTREWPLIQENLPQNLNKYFEPFIGGGSTWLNVHAKKYYINDYSKDLMNLYYLIQNKNNNFINIINIIINAWKMPYAKLIINKNPEIIIQDKNKLSNFIDKIEPKLTKSIVKLGFNHNNVIKQLKSSIKIKSNALKRQKEKNIKLRNLDKVALTSIKMTLYTLFRSKYNNTQNRIIKTALYWYLREYAYSSMFRFNKNGGFNVPYGGISYNNKSMELKLNRALSIDFQKKIKNTVLDCEDFQKSLEKYKPSKDDFVFLDPPYDTKFSTYDKNSFDCKEQKRLADFMINKIPAKFMLVIKKSKLIESLYQNGTKTLGGDKKLYILKPFEKEYQVSFQARNNRNTKHLIIKNYMN